MITFFQNQIWKLKVTFSHSLLNQCDPSPEVSDPRGGEEEEGEGGGGGGGDCLCQAGAQV